MGTIPPPAPLRLNLDRHGMPRDFFTYMWVVYGRRVEDNSPSRRAFLGGGGSAFERYVAPYMRAGTRENSA